MTGKQSEHERDYTISTV